MLGGIAERHGLRSMLGDLHQLVEAGSSLGAWVLSTCSFVGCLHHHCCLSKQSLPRSARPWAELECRARMPLT
jgi:hypothetical protein